MQSVASVGTGRDRAGRGRGEPGGRGGRGDVRERQGTRPIRYEAPRVGDRRAVHAGGGVRVAERAVHCGLIEPGVCQVERACNPAELLRPERLLSRRDGRRLRGRRDVVVADERGVARPGVELEQAAGVGEGTVGIQPPVRPHRDVAGGNGKPGRWRKRRLHAPPHRVHRDDVTARVDEERDIGERERGHVQRQRRRVCDVEELRRGSDIRREREGPTWPRQIARVADVVLGDPNDRVDRLEPDKGVGGILPEGGVEDGRKPLVARHGHVVAKLLGGIRRRDRLVALERSAAGGQAGGQLHRADERIERTDRAPREIVEVVALAGGRLVVGDVRVATDVDQPAVLVEHRDREVAPDAGPVVDVEDGGPGFEAVVDTLDLLEIEREGVPVHVGRVPDLAGHADRVAVGLQQVADVLGGVEGGVARRWNPPGVAHEQRVAGQPLHVDTDRGIADVGILHRRAGLLVELPQPDAKLVGAAGDAGDEGRADEVGLVGILCRGGVVAGLAADPDEELPLGTRAARQNDPHPGIAAILRVMVMAEKPRLALLQGQGGEPRRRQERSVGLGIGRAGDHLARGVEQLDHGVEAGGRLVEVDPDLGAAGPSEAVDVHVGRGVGRDEAVHLEAQPAVLVAALLLGRLPGVGAGGEVGGERAQRLGEGNGAVGIHATSEGWLGLDDHRHVPVVGKGEKLQAPPVAGGGRGSSSVGIGVGEQSAERIEARPGRVVTERGQDDGIAWLADDLYRAPDPVIDVELIPGRREAGVGPVELDHEARPRPALEPHARGGVEVFHPDLALEHVDDVGVVPDGLGGDLLAADVHAQNGTAASCGRDHVAADERPLIVVEGRKPAAPAGAPAGVGQPRLAQRIGVDAHDRAGILPEVVAHDDRLGPADEDRRRRVAAAAVAATRGEASGVPLDAAVG